MGKINSFRAFLNEQKRIVLDSMIFVYYAEAHPQFGPLSMEIFSSAEQGKIKLYTSTLTITEVLIGYRRKKDYSAEDKFWSLLQAFNANLSLIPLTVEIADRAASLRTLYSFLRTPDALHLATAIAIDTNVYITNDRKLKAIKEVPVIVLGDFL